MSWLASSFGSPSSTRCSQVTWLRSVLLSTRIASLGSDQRRQYLAIVISSALPFICIAPSPTRAIGGRELGRDRVRNARAHRRERPGEGGHHALTQLEVPGEPVGGRP